MNTIQTVISVVVAVFCVMFLIVDISLFISWSKAKEKAFITNWTYFIYMILGIVIFITKHYSIHGWLFLLLTILSLPWQFTCLSPEGIRTSTFINKGLLPVDQFSYEYKQNQNGKENLYIYGNNKPKPSVFNIGIKKTKTVKMLADWYGKHDYENPLIK